MRLIIGSDHAGFPLKEEIVNFLKEKRYDFVDITPFYEEVIDYPIVAEKVARRVASEEFDAGILICATGMGMSIAANKIKGIRAALCNDMYLARDAKTRLDANIITLGGRVIGADVAKEIIKMWVSQKFEHGRHSRRLEEIKQLEEREEGPP